MSGESFPKGDIMRRFDWSLASNEERAATTPNAYFGCFNVPFHGWECREHHSSQDMHPRSMGAYLDKSKRSSRGRHSDSKFRHAENEYELKKLEELALKKRVKRASFGTSTISVSTSNPEVSKSPRRNPCYLCSLCGKSIPVFPPDCTLLLTRATGVRSRPKRMHVVMPASAFTDN